MRDRKYLMKRCQSLMFAGAVAVMAGLGTQTVWANGPGEAGQPSFNPTEAGPGTSGPGSSGGPGSSVSPAPGSTGGPGGSGTPSQPETSTSNPNAWKRSGGNYVMPDGSMITNVFRRGIDVSRWQGEINWSQVAADDVSFVMLGTRSKGEVDPNFHRNIQGAVSAGVQVGAYIYSLATTPEMALEEADFVINLIKDYPVSYPVALDMEDSVQAALSADELAAIANAFCQRIAGAGYYPIIYANEYWLNNHLDMSKMNYPVWVARYNQKPTYSSPVMWQATSTGSVKGIGTNVDIDFQFHDFSSVIPANTWRNIGGNYFYYADYAMQKDSWIHDGDGWYYMGQDGLALKNWQMLGGERYYLDADSGKMRYGWMQDGSSWYYLGSSGAAVKGWINDNGTWYYGDQGDGAMRTGWLEDGGQFYYLNDSGRMVTGWVSQDNRWYYMGGSGAMSRGWIQDGDSWYYLDQNGVMQTGWKEDNGHRYFLKESGQRAEGWRQVDGIWYYFDEEGRMTTDWQMVDGSWYYLGSDGHLATGLTQVNGVNYYLSPEDGRMAADTTLTVGDVTYHADASGALTIN